MAWPRTCRQLPGYPQARISCQSSAALVQPEFRLLRDRYRQVLPVPGGGPLDGLAEVVPQMPPVGYLHRLRRAASAAV